MAMMGGVGTLQPGDPGYIEMTREDFVKLGYGTAEEFLTEADYYSTAPPKPKPLINGVPDMFLYIGGAALAAMALLGGRRR
jgi:hypothetical protein